MAQSILFRGAVIRYADLRFEKEGGVFARLHIQADLSGPVCETLAWGEIPEGVSTAKLIGKLTGRHLVLTPNDKALRQHEIQMECTDIGDFAAVTEKDDQGEVNGYRLNFIARSSEVGAIAKVEQYRRTIGSGDAALKVAYISQGTLDDGKDEAEESANASLDFDQDSDEPAATPFDEPLPSAVQMAGNMDGLKKQRRARAPKGTPLPADPGSAEWGSTAEVV